MTSEPPVSESLLVLVYSSDATMRERIRLAVGRRPAPDITVEYVEVADAESAIAELDQGVDLAILDGEAHPTGGIGLCRRAKEELRVAPPILVLVGRRDDAWLATWARADATLLLPLDPLRAAGTVAELLRTGTGRGQVPAPSY